MQLDTRRYVHVRIQRDTAVGYSRSAESAAKWLDTGTHRDTKDTVKYCVSTGYRWNTAGGISANNTHQGRATTDKLLPYRYSGVPRRLVLF